MIKIVLSLLLAAFAGNALAANINIGPNGCTLADAITSANTNSAVGNCVAGSSNDSIIAPDGWVVTLNSDLPTISSDMTIRSASSAGILTIDGNNERRVLHVYGTGTDVTLLRVQIRNGKVHGDGAGILIANANVRLESSKVVSNESTLSQGSAIHVSYGDLIIDRSTVRENVGHGVFMTWADVHVLDSSFVQNSGAGIASDFASLIVERSLFDQSVRGINASITNAEIVNTTFSSRVPNPNSPPIAFRFDDSSNVILKHVTSSHYFRIVDSTLRVSNSVLHECDLVSSSVNLNADNLYNSFTASGPDNCLGDSPNDYSLLALADNGGPTKTRAIGDPNSAAIGAGSPTYCEAVDQRGEARGAACDIGAYEATGFADVAVSAHIEPGAPYVSDQNIIVFAEVENSGPGIATNVRFDIDRDFAFVSNVNSPYCNALPCVITSIQPGQTLVIPVQMTLSSYLNSPFWMELSTHTTVNSTYTDVDEDDPSGNNLFILSQAISPSADLALTMDLISAGPYYVGQTIQYQARIDNAGPQTASGIQLQFAPEHLNTVVFSGCASVSGSNCNVSNIASGSSRTIGIQAKITSDQFNAVGSVGATQVDINAENNVDDRNNGGGVSKADIAVVAGLPDSGPIHSLEYLEFKIIVTTGNEPASNIRLSYDFPGSDFIGIDSCSYPCIIPQMPANSGITLFARFFAPNFVPGMFETIDFHVVATPGQSDPNLSDNEARVVVQLEPAVDVGTQLNLISTPPFYAGQEIQYALRVGNGGPNGANAIYVAAVPENLTLRSVYSTLCQAVPCFISHLNEYDEENITLIYQIDSVGAFDLTAYASPIEFDHMSGNNIDSSNNGGTAIEPPNSDRIFADGFE